MSIDLIDLILIQSFNLDGLIEDYRKFFLALLPSVFIIACIIEYFDRMDTFSLVRRAVISILILTSVTGFYKQAIYSSIEAANEKLNQQKQSNLLLMDFFDVNSTMNKLQGNENNKFYKDKNVLTGTMSFLKYHIFGSFINDGFTTVVYFVSSLCLVLIKLVYSLVYYLGFGLIGIPCLIYLFPSMGNVLRGAILSFVWCLIVPHILVFIFSMIGSEIVQGYQAGQVIGGSLTGTILLFLLTLFIAFTPLIAMMIVNGSGMAQAGGIIGSIGANAVMNLPGKIASGSTNLAMGNIGPKMQFAKGGIGLGKGVIDMANNFADRKGRRVKKLQELSRLNLSEGSTSRERLSNKRNHSKDDAKKNNLGFNYNKGEVENLKKESRLGIGFNESSNQNKRQSLGAKREYKSLASNSAFGRVTNRVDEFKSNASLGVVNKGGKNSSRRVLPNSSYGTNSAFGKKDLKYDEMRKKSRFGTSSKRRNKRRDLLK